MSKYPPLVLLLALYACESSAPAGLGVAQAKGVTLESAPVVKPPFEVRGEAEGLLLTWTDEQGAAHIATKRSDVPEARRTAVRVDSLELSPDKRLDPAFIYLADLSKPAEGGSYIVRKVEREVYEASLEPKDKPAAEEQAATAKSDEVILYGASWCGACKAARQFLEKKGVAFVEKDIEREAGARSEMMSKAQAQGVNASGIPVIDVYGTMMGGFDPQRMEQLLARK